MSLTDNVQKTAKTARCGLLDRAVKPGDIIVGDRLRALDRDSVERLKESISWIGLRTPISVRSSEQGWTLVSGRHRMEACIELGMDEIPVVAETVSELDARLWEIAENLHPAELTALERAEHISQWIRLRNQTAESQPCDQADNKLGQVGPVSELNKVAPVAPVLAPGGCGREGGIRAAALMGRRQCRPGTDPTEISRVLTRGLPQTDELLRRETLSAPPKPSIPR